MVFPISIGSGILHYQRDILCSVLHGRDSHSIPGVSHDLHNLLHMQSIAKRIFWLYQVQAEVPMFAGPMVCV